jgi:hypothetical protein
VRNREGKKAQRNTNKINLKMKKEIATRKGGGTGRKVQPQTDRQHGTFFVTSMRKDKHEKEK